MQFNLSLLLRHCSHRHGSLDQHKEEEEEEEAGVETLSCGSLLRRAPTLAAVRLQLAAPEAVAAAGREISVVRRREGGRVHGQHGRRAGEAD